jgi:uncharacterized lipoprotein YbaY
MWGFTIDIYGDTYIEPGVPYMVTCNVSHFQDIRRTTYFANISVDDQFLFILPTLHPLDVTIWILVNIHFVKGVYVPVMWMV